MLLLIFQYNQNQFVFHHVNIMCLASPSDLASVAGGLGSVLLVLTLCSGTFIILKKRKRKSGTGNSLFVIIGVII